MERIILILLDCGGKEVREGRKVSQISPWHTVGTQYVVVMIMQRGTKASSQRMFYSWMSASFSSSVAFAKLCHIYLPSFISLQSFPFLMSYIRIQTSASPVLQKGNDEANDGKRVCRRNYIHSFFHTPQVLQEIASRSLDEKTLFKSQELQFEGCPFSRPISCHSARTQPFPLEHRGVYFTILIWCCFIYPVCANPNLAPTLYSKC